MSKYIDADRLRAEIKRQIRLENLNFAALGGGGQTFCINTLEWVLKRIDSLQQDRTEVDLDNEIDIWYNTIGVPLSVDALRETARHFYELGKKSNWKPSDEQMDAFKQAVKLYKEAHF